MARLCLNMIVKNEAQIIERCLASIAPFIDCYVICDTGSSDDTVRVIDELMVRAGVPGKVERTTFANFEQARNDALDAAVASEFEFDYILLCDADMELVVSDPGFRAALTADAYHVIQRTVRGLEYPNIRLVRRHAGARYRGVTHEYLSVSGKKELLKGVAYFDHASGANRKGKYERDIALLKEGLEKEPDNSRYVFYMANSYFDLGDYEEALRWYERRSEMAGYREEVFYSCYRAGSCLLRLGKEEAMIASHLSTFERFPHRAEPLHALAKHMQQKGRHRLAYHFANIARDIPQPAQGLFVESSVYAWRLEDICAVSLYWLGDRHKAADHNARLLEVVPEEQRARILKNLAFCQAQK